MVGYAIWLSFCLLLLGKVVGSANGFCHRHRAFPYIGAAILCGFFGLQFTGWVIASYRIPYIWFVLGLAAAYIKSPESMETGVRARRADFNANRSALIEVA